MHVTPLRTGRAGRMLARGLAAAAVVTAATTSLTAAAAAPAHPQARAASPGTAQAAASQAAGTPAAGQAGAGFTAPLAAQLGISPACDTPAPRQAQCMALVDSSVHWTGKAWTVGAAPATRPRTAPSDTVASPAVAVPEPFMAADLQSAYHLPSSLLGSRQTIAIVDAGDDPTAADDLNQYRQANSLPACDANFPCFEKVNQQGQPCGASGDQACPQVVEGWPVEESLDLDMTSAICPNCKVILVEASSADNSDLFAAEDAAAGLGVNVISNSWGEPEYYGEAADCSHFDHPGIAITFSSGDSGFAARFPAVCSGVTAVGGTTLYQDTNSRGWSENPWSGDGVSATGGGCSADIPKPAWQQDPLCGMRTTTDVSAVADPTSPVAIYDTFGGVGGWAAVGGTSAASPVIAGVYALAGNTSSIGPGASWIYAHHTDLFDVTSGFEGTPGANGDCGGSYLCTAGPGYDSPTGWGTPDGIGAF